MERLARPSGIDPLVALQVLLLGAALSDWHRVLSQGVGGERGMARVATTSSSSTWGKWA